MFVAYIALIRLTVMLLRGKDLLGHVLAAILAAICCAFLRLYYDGYSPFDTDLLRFYWFTLAIVFSYSILYAFAMMLIYEISMLFW